MERRIRLVYDGVITSKKNSKQIIRTKTGAPRIISNAKARQQEQEMQQSFEAQLIKQGFRRDTSNKARAIAEATAKHETYVVDFTIYPPDNIRRDLDNQVTSLLDAMVKAGVIVDDCFKFLRGFTVRAAQIDRVYPRAEIEVVIRSD